MPFNPRRVFIIEAVGFATVVLSVAALVALFSVCEDQADWDTYTFSASLIGIHLRWDEYRDGEYPWGLCMSLTTMLRSGWQSNVV